MNAWLIKARLQPFIFYLIVAGILLFGSGVGFGLYGFEMASKFLGVPGLACLGIALLLTPIYVIAFLVSSGVDAYDSIRDRFDRGSASR